MKSKLIILLVFILALPFTGLAQMAINQTGNNPDTSAMLEITHAKKGILIPRINLTSLTDATTIPLPATSLLVYNTNAALAPGVGFYFNSGTTGSPVWMKLVTLTNTGNIVNTGTLTNNGVVSSVVNGETVKLERSPMGEVSMTSNATATTITTQNTYTKVAGTTTFPADNYQFSDGGTSNRLTYTGPNMKMFHIAATLSFSASTTNSIVKAVIFKNNTPLSNGTVTLKLGNSGDIVSTAIHVAITLSTNDYLELRIMNTSGTGTITVVDMNMFALGMSMGMD